MKQKVVITAANGFLGKALAIHLSAYYQVIALVRKPVHFGNRIRFLLWDGYSLGEWDKELDGALAVINLAGRSVDCRYHAVNRRAILQSRLASTQVIDQAIQACKIKPEVWLNSASATIYRHAEDRPMTELNGEVGYGFSVDVCRKWEQKFLSASCDEVRKITLRTAIVLGADGGVMRPFERLVRFGFGGRMGSGNQRFSWIHIHDFCRAVHFLIEQKSCKGAFNLSSPKPITNAVFMQNMVSIIRPLFVLPNPEWLLEFGARLIRTETELILKSRWVLPEKLLNQGFQFEYEEISSALESILVNTGLHQELSNANNLSREQRG